MFYILFIMLLFYLDYRGKEEAKNNFRYNKKNYYNGKVQLCYVENRGIAFNMLNNKKLLIVLSNLLLLIYLLYLILFIQEDKLGFLLIFTGGIGNLYDRIKRGYVIDYIYFNIKKWPVFNMSDFYVFIGVILVLVR